MRMSVTSLSHIHGNRSSLRSAQPPAAAALSFARNYLFQLLFIVFYIYRLTGISYSMYIYIFICSIDTSTCFNSMSSNNRYYGTIYFYIYINRLKSKRGSLFYSKNTHVCCRKLLRSLLLSSYLKR